MRLGIVLLALSQAVWPVPPDTLQTERMLTQPNLPQESVATSDDITALYFNPAGLGYHPIQVGYFYGHNQNDQLFDHTLFLNIMGFAFSSQWRSAPEGNYARHFSVGTGILNSRFFSMGTSYSWYDSSQPYLNRYAQWDLGFMLRPFRYLSLGAVARALNEPLLNEKTAERYWDLGIAIRPLPKAPEALTISVDTSWRPEQKFSSLLPRYQLEVIPVLGTTIYGGWDNFANIFFGSKFAMDISQISFQANVPQKQGTFFSGGVLFGRERFRTGIEVLGRWLNISLDTPFQEHKKEGFLFKPDNTSFYEIIRAIEMAKLDSQIRGIILTGRNFPGGWGQAEELRAALADFNRKKPVFAYLESAGNKEYYIASVAEKISMPPGGFLELNGLKAESYFLKDLLTKAGIQADYIAIGDYKSAPDMFTRNSPSEFDKAQTAAILRDLLSSIKEAILKGRENLTEADLERLLSRGIFSAQKARESGLIDRVEYAEDFEEEIASHSIVTGKWQIELTRYIATKFYDDTWGMKPEIAIVILDGEIVSGTNRPSGLMRNRSIGSDDTIAMLKDIRNNRNIDAVILRINSPGGSSLASDVIWKEIRALAAEKKSVVVSIGDVAASGGYYLAVGADKIIANNNSITGSIGVFGGKFSLKGLYEWLGVKKHITKTHPNAAIFSESDTFTEQEKLLLREQMSEFYNLFLDRVERSRQIGRTKVEQNAAGRVYSGRTAAQNQMVDAIGGMQLALEMSLQQAKLDRNFVNIALYPQESESLLSLGSADELALPFMAREALRLVKKTDVLKDDKLFFIMPYDIEIN